jgi:hypothetical protein
VSQRDPFGITKEKGESDKRGKGANDEARHRHTAGSRHRRENQPRARPKVLRGKNDESIPNE